MALKVIIGEDDFLVAEAARRFLEGGGEVEVIDSNASSNEDARLADIRAADLAYHTPPFLEPRKATWWKNVRFLPGARDGQEQEDRISEAVKEALLRFAEKVVASPLPDNQDFVISGPRLRADTVFAKRLASVGELVVFKPAKPKERACAALSRLVERAAELKLAFAPGAAERLVAVVGSDTRTLYNELEKLNSYLGEDRRTARVEDVEAIASPAFGVEPELWGLADAVGGREVRQALVELRRHERDKGFAILVSTVLERTFRQLAELKDADMRGEFDAASAMLPPFVVGKYRRFLAKWTLRELRLARWRFLRLRERAVTISDSADVLVATELLRVLRPAK